MAARSAAAFSRCHRSGTGIPGLAGVRKGLQGWANPSADGIVFPCAGAASIRTTGPIPVRTVGPARPAGAIPVGSIRATRALAGADDPKTALAGLAGIAEGFQTSAALAADGSIFHGAHLRSRFGPGPWRRTTARSWPSFDAARKHGEKKGECPCLRLSGKADHGECLLVVSTRSLPEYLQLKKVSRTGWRQTIPWPSG